MTIDIARVRELRVEAESLAAAPFLQMMALNPKAVVALLDALETAHAAGYREGLDAAAAWHEEQGREQSMVAATYPGGSLAAIGARERSKHHNESAAALRTKAGEAGD